MIYIERDFDAKSPPYILKQAGWKLLKSNIIEINKQKYKYFKSRDIEGIVKTLQMKNPRLWWPNGYGEQYLYNGSLSLISPNKDTLDVKKMRSLSIRSCRSARKNSAKC